jgi:3-oxoacyl-[acyl-carrier protein] reductase
MNPSDLLKGKVALITGASKGIGKALAVGLASAGASIACVARTKELLDLPVDEIHQNGGRALALVADVTKEPQVQHMLQATVEHFGRLDILVLNAGGNLDHDLVEEGDSDSWRETVELNLFGPYYCAKAAIPYLKANGAGKIISIGSGVGHRGVPKASAYACAKAGLWMLTRVLAQELQRANISVNELIPGPVDTGGLSGTARKSLVERHNEWLKKPEDVVQLAVFLATQPDVGPTAQSFSLMRRDN